MTKNVTFDRRHTAESGAVRPRILGPAANQNPLFAGRLRPRLAFGSFSDSEIAVG